MSVRIGAAAVCGFVAALAVGSGAQADCKVGQIALLPVTMDDMQPLVPVKINGADVMLLADSGAFYSVLSPSTASDQQLPHQSLPFGYVIIGVGGAADPYLTTVKTFTLAKAPLKNVEFIVSPGVGGHAAGVLGQNVLGLADVEYDFAHGAIRLMEAKGCGKIAMVYWEPNKAFSAIDIEGDDARGRVTKTIGFAYVNGARIKVQFDTGAWSSMITRAAARRAGIKMDDPEVKPAGYTHGVGGRLVSTWTAPVASFKIGDEEIRNTKLRVADTDLADADMLLGADFFQSHRVYVANSQRKLYFTYNGGPVFNLTARTLEQDGQTGVAKESTVAVEGGPEPTDADGFSRRGAALASRHEFERAIADFDHAIALGPKEPTYLYQRGMARWRNSQPFQAMADFDAAVKLKPDYVDALIARAELHLTGHDHDAAATDLDSAAAAAPKDSDLRLRLGGLYSRADRLNASIAQLDLWVATHRDEALMAEALNDRCWDRALLGRELDLALKDCDKAVSRAKNSGFLDSRGLVHLRLGEFDKAIADYDAALAISPKIAWSLYGRGLAKQHLGQQAEGQKDIDAAVALQADLPKRAKGYGIVTSDAVAAK